MELVPTGKASLGSKEAGAGGKVGVGKGGSKNCAFAATLLLFCGFSNRKVSILFCICSAVQ